MRIQHVILLGATLGSPYALSADEEIRRAIDPKTGQPFQNAHSGEKKTAEATGPAVKANPFNSKCSNPRSLVGLKDSSFGRMVVATEKEILKNDGGAEFRMVPDPLSSENPTPLVVQTKPESAKCGWTTVGFVRHVANEIKFSYLSHPSHSPEKSQGNYTEETISYKDPNCQSSFWQSPIKSFLNHGNKEKKWTLTKFWAKPTNVSLETLKQIFDPINPFNKNPPAHEWQACKDVHKEMRERLLEAWSPDGNNFLSKNLAVSSFSSLSKEEFREQLEGKCKDRWEKRCAEYIQGAKITEGMLSMEDTLRNWDCISPETKDEIYRHVQSGLASTAIKTFVMGMLGKIETPSLFGKMVRLPVASINDGGAFEPHGEMDIRTITLRSRLKKTVYNHIWGPNCAGVSGFRALEPMPY